ncbi:MAG TPA: hypothetical protein VF111_04510, partial [Thermoanaerobaculia bacterium]
KIGDVQGLPYQANLGDTAGAASSYRKAVEIAAEVRARGDADENALALLAEAHDRLGVVEQRAGRWEEAYRGHAAARAIRITLPPSPRRDVALARTLVNIGDCVYVGKIPKEKPRAAYEAALAALDRVSEQGPHRLELLRERGRSNQRLGGYFTGLDRDLPRAIAYHDAALKALEERAALDPTNAVAQRNYADQFVMKASAQNMARDGAGALAGCERAEAILERLALADPKNVEAQHDLAWVYEQKGLALMHLKRWDESEAAYRDAIEIRQKLVAADPTNREDRLGLAKVESMRRNLREARRR